MHRKGLIATAAVTLGITGASLSLNACGSAPAPAANQHTVTVTPAAPPNTSTATPPANAAPSPAQPEITNPWAVVSAYYGDIESGNYGEAWSLLSPSMQASLGPYSAWVAGYQATQQTTVSEVGQAGDTVTSTSPRSRRAAAQRPTPATTPWTTGRSHLVT